MRMAVLNLSIDLRTLKSVLQLPEPTQKLLDVQKLSYQADQVFLQHLSRQSRFVNENNLFAESTPQWYSSGSPTIAERAQAYNMPGVRVNGKDLFAVYQVAKEAIERARRGDGPTLIEAITYRNHGHFEGDEQKYKAPDGIEKEWADVDALEVFRDLVTEKGILSQDELDEIVAQSQKDVEDAIHFAQESPIPKEEALYEDVFAD